MRADVLELLGGATQIGHKAPSGRAHEFRRVNSRLEMLTDGRWQRYVPFRAVRELLGRPDRHAVETERRRLAKMRSRHRRPEVYRQTSRRYEATHKARRRELRIARYWENRPKMLAKLKAYRDKNRERFRADSLRRYYADRERRLVYMREYGKRRAHHQPSTLKETP